MTLQNRLLLPNTYLTWQQRSFPFLNDDFCHSNSTALFDTRTAFTMSVLADFTFELNLYLSLLQSDQLALRTSFKNPLIERLF